MSPRMPTFTILIFLLFYVVNCNGDIDLYLPEDQVYKLFGIQDAQLYYIRDGRINQNALNFVARVQPEHSVLKYIWHTTTVANAFYEISMDLSQNDSDTSGSLANDMQKLIQKPSTSLGTSGTVPTSPEMFEVHVDCTGLKKGNITFVTKLIIRISSEDSSRNFPIFIKRLKKCEKTHSDEEDKDLQFPTQDPKHNPDVDLVPPGSGIQQSTSAFYISVSVVSSVIVLIVVAVSLWHVRVNKRHQGHRPETLHRMQVAQHHGNQFLRLDLPNNAQKPPSHSSLIQFTPLINDLGTDISEIQSKLVDISLPRAKVTLGELMLKGTFARIYKGTLEGGADVLVKTVTDAATDEQKRLLLFESSLLRGMQHRNLLPMKHVVLEGTPLVLFQLMEGGNLKRYLQAIKLNEAPGLVPGIFSPNLKKYEQVTTQDLVEMAIQIACGMTYLSKRGLVHKDLAARNCMIDNDFKIKITDYALSRDAFPNDYCCLGDYENRPVRWLALESLIHKVYSSASDVWSFGVLLWEFQSLAAMPYGDIDDFEMADYLSEGFRLSQPINCPDSLYNIMAGCWHYSPDQRPTFTQLFQMLTEFHAELGDYV
ncbi:tyrosine-protein kinase RYK-like isoform X2 [Clavelina lepadiformis]|uniref:tyrosine-protein kinase RYK-like isoform X2 n=1 Tax=Clavelina lepadiformis TaxID=159417 RepID=UPI0040435081